MKKEHIIENGHLVEVKVFDEGEIISDSELKVKQWFENEKTNGYTFLKAFKEHGKKYTLFIKNEDLEKLLT